MATPPPDTTVLEDRVKPLSLADATLSSDAPSQSEKATQQSDRMEEDTLESKGSDPSVPNGTSLLNGTKETSTGLQSPSDDKQETLPAVNKGVEPVASKDEEHNMQPTPSEEIPQSESQAITEPVTSAPAQTEEVKPSAETAESTAVDHPLSPPATAPVLETTESQSAPAAPLTLNTDQDHQMTDAPPLSPVKQTREREEEDEMDEPAPKRAKTDGPSSQEESKAPEIPPPSSNPVTPLRNKFLIRTLAALRRTRDAKWFKDPVDYVKLNIPTYPEIVKNPMDLHTIEDKAKNGIYKTMDEVSKDLNLIVENCFAFNGTEHAISLEALKLRESWERHLVKLPGPDEVEPTAAEKKAKKANVVPTKTQPVRREAQAKAQPKPNNAASPTFALGPEGVPLIRRDSTVVDGRPKRSIHPPKNRDMPYGSKPKKKKFHWELKFCEEALDELHKPKHYSYAHPFYLPVDPVALNIPTYHNVIKKPMDLQTIRNKLQAGQYENSKEMEADVRLMFKNCYKFNPAGDIIFNAGKKLEEVFDAKWAQKSRWIESHDPNARHSESEENESSEEEPSEDEGDETLMVLQKQIKEMSERVEAIQKNKKKTPPAKKASKPKSSKKDTKKPVPGKKDKRSGAKPIKPEKQRWVTYREKTIISHGIGSLPDHKIHEALGIIQNNVPSLKGTNQQEVELDIDELPNNVLLLLLNFVRKHAPQAFEFDEPVPEEEPTPVPSKPKKNKPMNAHEQEAQIGRLAGTLSKFQGGNSVSELGHPDLGAESSDDDDVSEESEEE